MHKINIGFIGGCINKQKNIPPEKLYHSILKKHLAENFHDLEFNISLATYHSYNQLTEKANHFVSKNNLNILFIFIRPFPMMPLHKLIIKYDLPDGKKGLTIHPQLLKRKADWSKQLTEFQTTNDFSFIPKNKFGLRDINLSIGGLLGLHRWALRFVSEQLSSIIHFCITNSVTPVIISPPKNPESVLGNLICRRASFYFSEVCTKNEIAFLNINCFKREFFLPDKIHFNVSGHKKLSATILNLIQQKLNSIPVNSD